MASFWFWLFTVLLTLIGSLILTAIGFFLFSFLADLLYYKMGIPRNKKKLTNYIQNKSEKLMYPGKPEQIKKGVKEEDDEREKYKFRQFEKLRREELKRRRKARNPTDTEPIQERRVLSNESDTDRRRADSGSKKSSRKVKLD